MSLDLVNLRSETYTQDSRIPGEVQIGTPEQVSVIHNHSCRCKVDSTALASHITDAAKRRISDDL